MGNTGGGSILAPPAPPVAPADFILAKPFEFADEESQNYTDALETDQPPFDPVENDDYGSGQKEGCTQEMLFTGGASTYIPVFAFYSIHWNVISNFSTCCNLSQTCPTITRYFKIYIY